MPRFLVSFPNQDRAYHRIHSLAVVDTDSQDVRWIRCGAVPSDLGVTGFAIDGDILYCLIQSKKSPRLHVIDMVTWRILHRYHFETVGDPHSLCLFGDGLLVVSSADNALYYLSRHPHQHRILDETLFFRYPGCGSSHDEVHLNSLACIGGSVVASCFGHRSHDGWGQGGHVIDVSDGRILAEGLNHPHSVTYGMGRTAVASSRDGLVYVGLERDWLLHSFALPGYPRGLSLVGDMLYVGVSAMRRVSKSTGRPINQGQISAPPHIAQIDLRYGTQRMLMDLSDLGTEIYDLAPWSGPLPPPTAAPSQWVWAERLFHSFSRR